MSQSAPNTIVPNFIGIGAPKSGTTWLSKCLASHPQIFVADAKELVYFDYADADYERVGDSYYAHFSASNSASAVGEFTTRYLASRRPAPRIRTVFPGMKLLLCLRCPADQIYSHYWHFARQNFHRATAAEHLTFEQALDQFPDALLTPARYWTHLQYWLQFFPSEQLHIILYDDIVTAPETVMQGVYKFLGVDPHYVPPTLFRQNTEMRQGRSPRNSWARAIHTHLYATLSRRIYKPMKLAIGFQRADRIKEALRIRPLMESLFFRKGYPNLAADTRQALVHEFESEVTGLESFLKRDLSAWR